MKDTPREGYLRLEQIIGTDRASQAKKRKPKNRYSGVIPVSRSKWWAGVADGTYPEGEKIGPRTTAWRAEKIWALIERGE